MPVPQNPSIEAFNKLVDDLIALKDGHPDDQICDSIRGEDGTTHYLGMGKEVNIDGEDYLIAVNGHTSRARGSRYPQHGLLIHALSPLQASKERGQAVRYVIGSLDVFSGVRKGILALHESPSMESNPAAALVMPFGEWAVRSVLAENTRRRTWSPHPDPYCRMRPEDHPTAENLERILKFAISGEHVYISSDPADGWTSDAPLMVPMGRPTSQ